ncbi:MAG TPA: 3-hydroxyacyl-CoA dehydrogenase family protein [Polyangiaceae bacterium]|nr:3-hydroxyacyl-CoA dehydrogenase family protein [Polyangiaceae bacterium]
MTSSSGAPRSSGISRTGDIQRVAVLGCGSRGSELIHLCLAAGLDVTAVKLLPGDFEATRERLYARSAHELSRGARLSVTRELAAIQDADIVIEAAAESVIVKQNVLAEAERFAAPDVPLATTTGSLRLSEIGEALALDKRLVGLHFCKPWLSGGLVELATTSATATSALDTAKALCARLDKTTLVIGDQPGFIVNQLLVSHILHAIELVERGTAGIEEIDAAMKLSGLCPNGPFATADELGLDVLLVMAKNLYAEHADARFACPSLLRHLVRHGALGQKTSAGFYLYGETRTPNPAASPFANLVRLSNHASAA